jgi:hypothetical protein
MIYLLAALATYYLALSITREDGPFAMFLALRNRFATDTWIARGLRCLVCMSCWTGLLLALQLLWMGQILWSDVPLVWLGLAGASVVIDKYWRR